MQNEKWKWKKKRKSYGLKTQKKKDWYFQNQEQKNFVMC